MRQIRNLWILIGFLFLSTPFYAQMVEYNALSIPKTLMENANAVVRKDFKKFKIDSPKSATLEVKYVVTILNNSSREDVQGVAYDKQSKITNLEANIYDAFGKLVRHVKARDFRDQSSVSDFSVYEDDRIKFVELNHNSYPYTIEFMYTKTFKRLPFYPSSYLQHFRKSVESFEFIVIAPEELGLNYKSMNIDLEPMVEQNKKKILYRWQASDLPALKKEPFAPYPDQITPAIRIAPTRFQYDRYEGDMSSWNSFGKFIYDLNKGRDQLSPEMVKVVQTLIADAKDDREKIKILYNYLQENMRYVSVQLGIGGWQTFDANYVEKNKYGDCKALSNFMKAILKEAGITSHAALIYNSRENKIQMDSSFAVPAFANHMILSIPSEEMWLECTSNYYPPNYLGAGNQDRQTLLITEEGGKISRTPVYDLDLNKKSTNATIEINEEGGAIIRKQQINSGPKHDRIRYLSNYLSQDDIEKEFLENTDLPAFAIDQLTFDNKNDQPETQIDFHITVPRYASKAGKRIFLPINKLNPLDGVPEKIEQRIHPVHVKEQYKEDDLFIFILPTNYKIESIPQDSINLESEFGKYKVVINVKNGQMIYKRMLEIYTTQLPPDRYDDLRNFYIEIAKADAMKIVLVKKKT